MRYLKTLGLLAVAAAALTAFAGTASATLTSPTGEFYSGTVEATATGGHFTGTVKVACNHSALVGSNSGGGTTVTLSTLHLTSCGTDTVAVIERGNLIIEKGEHKVRSNFLRITILTHKTIFGIPVTSHCLYATSSTPVGTITDSHATGGKAVIDINGEIPRVATDSACGEDPAIWTGIYTVSKPAVLYVD